MQEQQQRLAARRAFGGRHFSQYCQGTFANAWEQEKSEGETVRK